MDARIVLTLDDSGAIKKAQDFNQALKDVQGTTKTTHNAVSGFGEAFRSLAGQFAIGNLAANAITKTFRTIKDTFIDSIKEAADYEKSVKGLEAAFEISGRNMPGMTERLKNYADELQALGLADDGAILKAESLTMQLTSLNEKGIKQATRGAVGLSSVFGMDLASAAETAARAMEGNYIMLGRMIPSVRLATTEEGKHAAMLKAFEGLYARAIADTQTYAGQVKKLGIEWAETKKHLGEAILKTGILQSAMESATFWLEAFGEAHRKAMADGDAFAQAELEASQILWKVGEATGKASSWAYDLGEKYHWTAQQVLENVRAGTEGIKEQKAAEEAVKNHNAAVAAQGKAYNETGSNLSQFLKELQKFKKESASSLEGLAKSMEAIKSLGGFKWGVEADIPEATKEAQEFFKVVFGGYEEAQPIIANLFEVPDEKVDIFKEMFSGVIDKTEELRDRFKQMADDMDARWKRLTNRLQNNFARAFDQLRFTTQGFKDFFIGIWNAIKEAFIQCLVDMLAKWGVFTTIMSAVKGIFSIFGLATTPLMPELGNTGKLLAAQTGFSGVVSRPTLMLVGEAGPETINVRPGREAPWDSGGAQYGRGVNLNLTFNGVYDGGDVERVVRQKIVPVLKEVYAHGEL